MYCSNNCDTINRAFSKLEFFLKENNHVKDTFPLQIIALENNMKTPQYFGGYCGVLNIGMTVIVALYILIGFFGYIKYGSSASGSVTFNLPADEV